MTSPKPERTLQLSKAFNRYVRIEDTLPSVYSKPNSKYGTKKYLMMCSKSTGHEGISQRCQDKIKKFAPGPDCSRIGGSSYLETRDSCDKMLSAILDDPRISRLFKKPVDTATDEHDVAAMFKDIESIWLPASPRAKPASACGPQSRRRARPSAVHPGKRYNKVGIVRQLERTRRTSAPSCTWIGDSTRLRSSLRSKWISRSSCLP